VHCNLGWGGDNNGWYASGVFDARKYVPDTQRSISGGVPQIQRSVVTQGENKYYQFNIEIIPYLQPSVPVLRPTY
jgi:hypothetical protein